MQLFKVKWLAAAVVMLSVLGMAAGCAPKAQQQAPGQASNLSGTVKIAGSTSVQPLSEDLTAAFMKENTNVKITVAGGGTGAGIKAAQDGTADIGAASRDLTPDEAKTVTAIEIARDGVAVIVHPSNKVNGLTMDQVKKIFAGEITNWKDAGGADASINLFTREEGSGTRGAFQDIVMGKATISTKAGVQNSTGAIRTAVSGDPNAVGYISLGDMDSSVKSLTINGVAPSVATVIDKTYKLNRPFLYLTKGEPAGVTKAFIDWTLSPAGQAIVGQKFVKVK